MAKKKNTDMKSMGLAERARTATMLGNKSADIMNKALARTRKLLEPYGYTMNMDLHFCELQKPEENQTLNPES